MLEPSEDALSPTEIKRLKSNLTATKTQLRIAKAAFGHRLNDAGEALDDSMARQIVLDALERDVVAEAQDRISRHRRSVTSAFETWWDKYRAPLFALEAERDAAAVKLAGFLKELGYA